MSMRLLPLLFAFLFAFCVLQGSKQRGYGEEFETIVIENDLFFKESRNDITVTGTWLAQNQFLLSVESEQVSLTMNLDVSGDKGKKGNGTPNTDTTRTPKDDMKHEKIHNIGTCPLAPRHITSPRINNNGTCKPRVPDFISKVWSLVRSVKKQGGFATGKALYGLRVMTEKGWNTGGVVTVKGLDCGAMIVGTGTSIVGTTIETGNWLADELFDGGKVAVDMALDVGWKLSQIAINGLIYLKDFAVMVYTDHIEGYLLMIRDMPWDAMLLLIELNIVVTVVFMIIGYLLKKLRKPPKRILPARMSPAGRRRPINTPRRRTS